MISWMSTVILIHWHTLIFLKSEKYPCISAKFPGNDRIIFFGRLWLYCKCHHFCCCNVSVSKNKTLTSSAISFPLMPIQKYWHWVTFIFNHNCWYLWSLEHIYSRDKEDVLIGTAGSVRGTVSNPGITHAVIIRKIGSIFTVQPQYLLYQVW